MKIQINNFRDAEKGFLVGLRRFGQILGTDSIFISVQLCRTTLAGKGMDIV